MRVSTLALAFVLVVHGAAGKSTPLPSDWEVVVRPYQAATTESEKFYWVGLRNKALTTRAFCLLGVRYSYDLEDGSLVDQPTKEYPSVGSPHPCAAAVGHLVLPGETHFVKVRVALPKEAEPRGAVRFRITAEETCADREPCKHTPIIASEEKADVH